MQVVKIEPFNIIGISVRTTNEKGRASKEIAELWATFIAEYMLTKIPNKVDNNIYSLYSDYESDHTRPYTAIIGCSVGNLNSIPKGMVGKSFDGGNYVNTTTKGDLKQDLIVKQWEKIFEMELDRTFVCDFEIFGEKAQDPSAAEVDFYVGVKN